jgi:hypothetical protein
VIGDRLSIRAGVALFVACRIVAITMSQAESAIVDCLLGLAVVRVIDQGGAEGGVAPTGQVAIGVVTVTDRALWIGGARGIVGLAAELVGVVVTVDGSPPIRISGGDQVTRQIVGVGDGLSAGADFAGLAISPVVGVAGGVAVGVGDADQVVPVVVNLL